VTIVTDHCDRDVPGYRLTVTPPTAQVAVDVLEMATQARAREYLGDLEIRTDGGPQFTAYAFGRAVTRQALRQTVTPARSPQHNPFAEAFLAAFKEECVYQHHWHTAEEALRDAEAWIEHYRHRREQNALGGLAPLEYRRELLRKIAA
jgi:transposase InsO family protein